MTLIINKVLSIKFTLSNVRSVVASLTELLVATQISTLVWLVCLVHVQVVEELVHIICCVIAFELPISVKIQLAHQQSMMLGRSFGVLEVIKHIIFYRWHSPPKSKQGWVEVMTTDDCSHFILGYSECIQLVLGY